MTDQKQPSPAWEDGVDPQSIAADPVRAGATVVFAGDPAQVKAGFLIALQLMGIDAALEEPCPGDHTGRKQ